MLLEPGDTVIAELFTYQGVVGRWRKLDVNVVGVPLDDDGMRMDALATTLADLRGGGVRPKFIYTIPTLQNPTGTVLGMERRHEMLRLSREYGVPIFEDECYADLVWEGEWPPAIYGLDRQRPRPARRLLFQVPVARAAPRLRGGAVAGAEPHAGLQVGRRNRRAGADGGGGLLPEPLRGAHGQAAGQP